MKTNRTSLSFALLGIATLIASLVPAGTLCAQESDQAAKKPKPAPQALWVMNDSNHPSISIFQPAQLKKSGIVGSAGILVNNQLGALTFDSSRNLWIGLCNPGFGKGALVELTRAGLRRLVLFGSAKFSVTILDPSPTTGTTQYLGCPREMQFDPSGNLWVQSTDTENHGPALIEYSGNQLAASGSPIPAATIETPAVEHGFAPVGMALDHSGNLWLANDAVVEYSAAQLAAGVQTDPIQTLDLGVATPTSLFPSAITFDANDNLWAVSVEGGTLRTGGLEMFAAADLHGEGTVAVTPARTINAVLFGKQQIPMHSFNQPLSLAFDSVGDLWVGNLSQSAAGGPGLVEFTPSQLSANGSPAPTRYIIPNRRSTNLGEPQSMTFGPALP